MKKNVITKLLIAIVMAMMVFALVACGNGNTTTDKGGKKDNTTKECTEHVDANKDGKCDVCGQDMPAEEKVDVIGKVVDIVKNVSGLIETLTSIKADGTVSLETALTAYYAMGDNEGNAAIKLAANASADDPELSLGVSVNDKDYFTLGYAAYTLYLLEGLNLINSEATSSNKIAMNVTALKPGIDSAMGEAMEALEALGSNEVLKNLDFEALGEELRGTVSMFEDVINELLVVTGDENGAKLELKAEALKNLLDPNPSNGILAGLLGEKYTNVLDTIDNVLATVGIEIGEGKDRQPLTVELLLNDYLPTIVIEIKYNKSKSISGIKVYFTIDKIDLEAGLDLSLDTFSTKSKANISFRGYTAQDLKTSIGLDFPQKGLSAVLDIVANTSTAFAADGNQVAGAVMTINNDAENKTFASFDGKTVYLDFTGAFKSMGYTTADQLQGLTTTYKFVMEKSITAMINDALCGISYGEEEASNAASDAAGGIWATLYNFVAVGMFGAKEKANATEEDCVKFVYELLGEDKYLTFLNANDTSFTAIGARIVGIYNLNKATLLSSVHAGTENNVYRAGVQVITVGEDGTITGGLIKFLAAFVNIPTITEGAEGKYIVDTENTMELTNIDTVVDYIQAAFNLYEGDHADEINSDMICRLVYGHARRTLKDFLSDGIYLGVGSGVNSGLDGYIEVRATKEGDQYAKLSGGIKFISDSTAYNTLTLVPEDISEVSNFTQKYEVGSEEESCEYYIQANLYRLFRIALFYQNVQ